MSNPVFRRYTPPTCTLKLIGSHSPLSQWTGKPVVKNLRFELHLDDPRLPEDQQVTLKGDRHQLDALHNAVDTYVQTILTQSSSYLNASLLAPTLSPDLAPKTLPPAPEPIPSADSSISEGEGIYLQPQGLIAHSLFLGTLANSDVNPVIPLSALQLFDLATALDEYAQDLLALPDLQHSSSRKGFPAFLQGSPAESLRIAASVLLALGLTTGGLKLLSDQYLRPSPVVTATRDTTNSTPSATLVTPPQASNQALPTPPAMGEVKPSPSPQPEAINVTPAPPLILNSPTPETFAIPQPAEEAGNGTVVEITPQPTSTPEITPVNPPDAPSQTAPLPVSPPPLPSIARGTVERIPESAPVAPATLPTAPELGNAPATMSAPGEPSEVNSGTAFDVIPQVAEAREFFQSRWQAPESLKSTIEYTLVVNANGSIRQIIPLGKMAETYFDRTGIPLVGEPFVAPLQKGNEAKIRVVLHPNGTVQTFLQ